MIVAGTFEVDPAQRADFLHSMEQGMRSSRREAGCLAYVLSADPIEPGRVVLYERWADKASLAAHLANPRPQPAPDAVPITVISSEIVQYEISAEGPLGS